LCGALFSAIPPDVDPFKRAVATRQYVFGYDVTHYDIDMNVPSKKLYLKVRQAPPSYSNRPVGVLPKLSVIDTITGRVAAPYVPNPYSLKNQIAAVCHRFARDMPRYRGDIARDFFLFSRLVVEEHCEPVKPCELCTLEQYLEESKYSVKRQKQFLKIRKELDRLHEKVARTKSFGKHESYVEPKNLRAINSPSDFCKVLLAPLVHSIEKKFFKMKWFVKYRDPKTYAQLLEETFGVNHVLETDYKSFEANMRGVYCRVLWMFLEHMMKDLQVDKTSRDLMRQMVFGTNYCSFKFVHVEIEERLMSGISWTSLANSLMNFLIMAFLSTRATGRAYEEGAKTLSEWFQALFEGDDGLTVDYGISEQDVIDMGLLLKKETYSHYTDAHFCGNMFDSVDQQIVTDPRKVFQKFCYLDSQYVAASDKTHAKLLRAKALSYKYLYNDVPIIGAFCQKVCDITRSYDVRNVVLDDHGATGCLKQALDQKIWKDKPCVAPRTRQYVAEKFHIPVNEQLVMEEQLSRNENLECCYMQLFDTKVLEHTEKFTSMDKRCVVDDGSISCNDVRGDRAFCHAERMVFIQHVMEHGFGLKRENAQDVRYSRLHRPVP
jgi:hypothetical protein